MKQWLLAASTALLVCGCATFEAADPALDRRAKAFKPVAGQAVVYYFRIWRYAGRRAVSFVNVDGLAMGVAAAGGYSIWILPPGHHRIIAFPAHNHVARGSYEASFDAGGIYYISEDYRGTGTPKIEPVDTRTGMAAVHDAMLIR